MNSQHVTIDNWPQILACFALGFCLCWALIGIILRRAEHGRVGQRKEFHHAHKEPIPRLGGVAMASAFVVVALAVGFFTPMPNGVASTLLVIVLSSLSMFTLGLWDDLRQLGAKFKLLAQIGIASSVYICNIRIDLFHEPFTGMELQLGAFGYLATVLWLVSLTNLINLIDGIDGLAGGIGLMLMLLMANLGVTDRLDFCALLAFGVAGSLLGFLKYNYPPARIYMGDGGAYFLGFLIGILSIVNSNKGTVAAALIAPAFALALPIVDVGLAILRRGARGLPVFRPDQKHIHHHLLITLGISRERTLLNLYTVSLLCLFLALCVFCLQGRMLPLFTGMLFLVLLVAGHLSGFTRNWFEVGSQLGQSLRLRKETRYALTLDRWFMMEAERRVRLEDLWEDYQFVIRKLGFSRLKLTLPGRSTQIWQAEGFDPQLVTLLQAAHEISDGTVVELSADSRAMPEVLFTLLGDLAAETWYKAALRCRALTPKPQPSAAGGTTDTGAAVTPVPELGGQPPDTLIRQGICS
ncbi:MAG TPA: MraY family glycosyltransferase [Candidatus Methylacidiphilales bacterium]|jgi:UDP-GlcNAc:undecaprenyl-phosphate GlcNAc-1-phosphate transferase|nr:MraY family glycosyltransferase [Candidatus Methylacidiphilales bacterium]